MLMCNFCLQSIENYKCSLCEINCKTEVLYEQVIHTCLTLSRVGRAEDYCNQSICLSVFYQNFWTSSNIEASIELPKDVKLYKDQNKT